MARVGFLLGYSEFSSEVFTKAAQDLSQAAQTGFSLVDFAVFYQASAASRAGNHLEAAQILQNFRTRFPNSHLHWQVLELTAGALEAEKPQEVIALLSTRAGVRDRPALYLLLAQAYQQVNRNLEAARAFQEVYFAFPTSLHISTAGKALESLRQQLGESYPSPTDEAQTGRLEDSLQKRELRRRLEGI